MDPGSDGGRALRVVFAGGGTGGHLYPAIAIAEALRAKHVGVEILFIGTANGLESRVVPAHGYPFEAIPVTGFRRQFSTENLLFAGRLAAAFIRSRGILKRFRPDAVVGTGGYVCGPPLLAASLLGVRTLVQEQNSYPGVTTRLLAHRVDEVHIAFEQSRKFLPRARLIRLSGNPVRRQIGTVGRADGAAALGLDPAEKTVLVFGGSQGAASLNAALQESLDGLLGAGLQVVWLTGRSAYEEIRTRWGEGRDRLRIYPYLERMEQGYAAADLALCRAGATTIAELTCAGVPSILVPYPHAAADHQTENAKSVAEAGAALLIPDGEIRRRLFLEVTGLMNDPERLAGMAARARARGFPHAAETLADAIVQLTGGHHG